MSGFMWIQLKLISKLIQKYFVFKSKAMTLYKIFLDTQLGIVQMTDTLPFGLEPGKVMDAPI
jgi:hypothetical protein